MTHSPDSNVRSPWTRTWLRRLAVALLFGCVSGVLVFVVARGVFGVVLFVQQQQALRDVLSVVGGGFEQPPSADLRAIRREISRIDQEYWRRSLIVALVGAVLAAIMLDIRLERRALQYQLEMVSQPDEHRNE